MKVLVDKCLKCDWPLSPRQIREQESHCEFCKSIIKGEEEAAKQEALSHSLHKANSRAMR